MAKVSRNLRNSMSARFEKIKVLVIDDHPEVRALVRDVLAESGCTRIYEACDGKEAMQFLDADFEMVDLIICDWNMPGMNGIDFLRQIRTVFPDLPFLMITGRADKNSVVDAKIAGVSAFIKKPFSPEQLEEKISILTALHDQKS